MNKEEIISIIKANITEIIPELETEALSPDETLANMGLNSVDRGELITLTLEHLELEVSRIEFAGANTINELADLCIEKRPG